MFIITQKIFNEITYMNPEIELNLENTLFIDYINSILKLFHKTKTSIYYNDTKWLLNSVINNELHLYKINHQMILIDMIIHYYNLKTIDDFLNINKYVAIDEDGNLYLLTPSSNNSIEKYLLVNETIDTFLTKINN